MTKKILGWILLLALVLVVAVLWAATHPMRAEAFEGYRHHHEDCREDCVTPTPIPTDTPTPEITPEPVNLGGPGDGLSDGGASDPGATQAPPSPSCTVPFAPAILQGKVRVDPTDVAVSWWASTDPVDSYSVTYGYDESAQTYGINGLSGNSTSYTIGQLAAGKPVWAKVWAWHNGCAQISNTLDP